MRQSVATSEKIGIGIPEITNPKLTIDKGVVAKRIIRAEEAAADLGIGLTRAISETIIKKRVARVYIPCKNSMNLKHKDPVKILTFENWSLAKLKRIDIPERWTIGDYPERTTEGKVAPLVWRNFYVLPEYLGKEITAEVTISKKTFIITGKENIVIDIKQIELGQRVRCYLKLKSIYTGENINKVKVPGTDYCIEFVE